MLAQFLTDFEISKTGETLGSIPFGLGGFLCENFIRNTLLYIFAVYIYLRVWGNKNLHFHFRNFETKIFFMTDFKSTHQGMTLDGIKSFITLQTRPWQPFKVFPGGNGPILSKLQSAKSQLPRVTILSNLVNTHLFRCTRRW